MSKLAALSGVLVLGLAACGPSARNGNGDDGSGGGGDGGTNADAHDGSGSACAISKSKAEQTPLDIFVMLDHSASMDDDGKWDSVTGAIKSFVGQASLVNVSVGLGYFGTPPSASATCTVSTCAVDADCGAAACGPCLVIPMIGGFCEGEAAQGGGDDSCVAADYAMPSVEISPLPGAASLIDASMAAHSADGNSTPTEPAIAGALQHAKAWATAHAGDAVVVVFATDGDPTGCDDTNDIPHAEADAMAGATTAPKVPTYVIGVGSDLGNLNDIATGGGTGSAFVVDANANANAQFLAAMNAIQHSALGCQYTIPSPTNGGSVNYGQVNVNYLPGGGGAEQTFGNVADAGSCPATGNGWYYDNEQAPTQIILCASTCATVEADTMGEVDIALGCTTVIE